MSDKDGDEAVGTLLGTIGVLGTVGWVLIALFAFLVPDLSLTIVDAVIGSWFFVGMIGWSVDICSCDDCQDRELTYAGMLLFLPFTVVAVAVWVLIQLAYKIADIAYSENRVSKTKSKNTIGDTQSN